MTKLIIFVIISFWASQFIASYLACDLWHKIHKGDELK